MPNLLKDESSPYLLQHAENPVEWYPWGTLAFERAQQLDRPVFLSVGYSSCHWCHVMEKDSFCRAELAEVLNSSYVSVKVDREERPDVDRVYMTFVQLTTGHGGWPMTLFLTPDLKPIFGATFIPFADTPQQPGLLSILKDFAQRWAAEKDKIKADSDAVFERMRSTFVYPEISPKDADSFFAPAAADRVLLEALDEFEASFDGRYGGFDAKPKFPTPCVLNFLAHTHCRLLVRVRASARKLLAQMGTSSSSSAVKEAPAPAPAEAEVDSSEDLPWGDRNREVTDEDRDNAQAHRGEAQALAAEGKLDEAVAAVTKAILLNPGSAILFAVRAEFLLKKGRLRAALRDCDHAVEISPIAARPLRVRGRVKAKLGLFEEAVLDLAKANQTDYDDDTYALLKELQATEVPKAAERRKREEQSAQIGITEAKATHCLHMMMYTLHCVSQGGITDHLAGGVARYSVDERWHVPHFEKMLYDNAQLVSTFCLAFRVDHRPLFQGFIRDTLAFVQREMTHPEGGFYSAQDADSLPTSSAVEPKEGAYYVWSHDEIVQLIKGVHPRAVEVFLPVFGIRPEGNVQPDSDPCGELRGSNVLYLENAPEIVAQHLGMPLEEVTGILAGCKAALWEARQKRPRPLLDDKIVTAWNGLMISAFATAYMVLHDEEYLAAARKAITFVRQKLYSVATETLHRCWRGGRVSQAVPPLHSDYAMFIQGLLDCYAGTGNPEMLRWALRLQKKADTLFGNAKEGSYYDYGEESMLPRLKEDHDGAEPSANAITALNLWRLGNTLQSAELLTQAKMVLLGCKKQMTAQPRSVTQLLVGVDVCSQPCLQVVVVGGTPGQATRDLLAPLTARLVVRYVLVHLQQGHELFKDVAYLSQVPNPPPAPLCVFLFEDFVLRGSATSGAEFGALLEGTHVL
eukprot:RCo034087